MVAAADADARGESSDFLNRFPPFPLSLSNDRGFHVSQGPAAQGFVAALMPALAAAMRNPLWVADTAGVYLPAPFLPAARLFDLCSKCLGHPFRFVYLVPFDS